MAAAADAATAAEANGPSASASADTLSAYAPLVAAAVPASASSSDLGSVSSSAHLPVVDGGRRRASGRLGGRRISVAAGECGHRSGGLDEADLAGEALVSMRTAPLASARGLDEQDAPHGAAAAPGGASAPLTGGAPFGDGAPPAGADERRLRPPRVGVGSSRGLARPPLSGLPRAATGGGSSSRAFARALSSVRLKLHRR